MKAEGPSGSARVLQIATGLLLLSPLAFCTAVNSGRIASGFPEGASYDRLLAYDERAGFRNGCIFAAYCLSAADAESLAKDPGGPGRLRLNGSDANNRYGAYRRTPVRIEDDQYLVNDAGAKTTIYALQASGGCTAVKYGLPSAKVLLQEPGNLYAASANGEGLSMVSPGRRLALYLYFG